MAKRLSEKQKEEMIKLFTQGLSIGELSFRFNCTKLTISRNLKRNMSEKEYKEFLNINKSPKLISKKKLENLDLIETNNKFNSNQEVNEENLNFVKDNFDDQNLQMSSFTEIIPLDYEIENSPQKDLTSVPITEVDFPNVVYMIVDKKIELETKYLKDYPEWSFLSQDELNRKTIEIYTDQKMAKRFCNKDQKVLKVPNTNVFKIVAPILIARGISRIVSPENLIAL